MSIEYWKARCKLAEETLEKLHDVMPENAFGPVVAEQEAREQQDDDYENAPIREHVLEALRILMAECEDDDRGDVRNVVTRLVGYSVERKRAITAAGRNGYPVIEHPDVFWLFERMLSDLNSGRQTIDFLSRPPKLPVEALPVGAVFTTSDGRLLEVKRERAEGEPLVTAYKWDRNVEPCTIDRKQLVQPIGRVEFSSARKQIVLGLLELSQHALAQVVVEGPKQLGG
jgi:hypothetical protein